MDTNHIAGVQIPSIRQQIPCWFSELINSEKGTGTAPINNARRLPFSTAAAGTFWGRVSFGVGALEDVSDM